MKDWREFDAPPNWRTMTCAERLEFSTELTRDVFKKAGLYPAAGTTRNVMRCLTFQQMNKEDELLDELLTERLRD